MLNFTRSNTTYRQTEFECEIKSDRVNISVDLGSCHDSVSNIIRSTDNLRFHVTVRQLLFDGFTYNINLIIQNQCITKFDVNYAYGNSNVPKLTQTTIQKLVAVIQEKLPMKDFTIDNISLLKGLIALRTETRDALIVDSGKLINDINASENEIISYKAMLNALSPSVVRHLLRKRQSN